MSDTKPYKTFQFWLTAALTNIGLFLASGIVIPDDAAQVLGWVVTTAAALGYFGWKPSAEAPKES